MKTILLVFAHPDDETFSSAATIAKYVKAGWTVNLICATRGEAGDSGTYENVNPDGLGVIRSKELEDAAGILGITSLTFLDYKDKSLKDLVAGELENKIYRMMVELSPDIVITFDTTGISNHPDHIKICYATTYAFQSYCTDLIQTRKFVAAVSSKDPNLRKRHFISRHKFPLAQSSFAEIVDSDTEPKLYYVCVPESILTYLTKKKIFPAESFGKPWKGTEDKYITTVIDISRYQATKLKAMRAHVSQRADVERILRAGTALLSQEFFILRMQNLTEVFMGKNDRVKDRL